jgi:hypothetical protein
VHTPTIQNAIYQLSTASRAAAVTNNFVFLLLKEWRERMWKQIPCTL